MKFKARTKDLVSTLQESTAIINERAVVPITKYVKFELQSVYLWITATDMQNTLIKQVAVEGDQDGAICLDGKILLQVLKTLQDQEVSLELNNKRIKLTAFSGIYEIPTEDAEDFPQGQKMDGAKKLIISSDILREGITKTVFAVSTFHDRNLENMLWRCDGEEMIFVGCDGPRLAEFKTQPIGDYVFSLMIGVKSANLIKSFINEGEIEMNYNERFIEIKSGENFLYCRLADGVYVNHKAIIPTQCSNYAIVDRIQLLTGVKRVMILANQSSHKIRLDFDDKGILLSAEDNGLNKGAKEEIEASFTGNESAIALNGKYMVDALNVIDTENVRIEFASPIRPILFRPEQEEDNYLALFGPYDLNAN